MALRRPDFCSVVAAAVLLTCADPAWGLEPVFSDGFERRVTTGCDGETPPVPENLVLHSVFANPDDYAVATRGIWAVWWQPPFDHADDAELILDRLETVRCNAIFYLSMRDPPNPGLGFYYNVYVHHGINDAFPDEWGNGQGRDIDGNPFLTLPAGYHLDQANLDHEGFHVFQFSTDSPGFEYSGDSAWYSETSAQWYLSTQAPGGLTTFVQIGTIEANPQLALWQGWTNPAPGDPTDWNYTVRQYGMHSLMHYLTTVSGVEDRIIAEGYYGGITQSPQAFLYQRIGPSNLRHHFANSAAANTADFDYLAPEQVVRARQEIAVYGDPGTLHHYVAEHTTTGTNGALLRPPTQLEPRGWAYNVIRVNNPGIADYFIEVLGDAQGSEGAASHFEARVVVITPGGAEYTPLDMISPQEGSASVSVPAGASDLFLVVVTMPEHFNGHQTYGYEYRIEVK